MDTEMRQMQLNLSARASGYWLHVRVRNPRYDSVRGKMPDNTDVKTPDTSKPGGVPQEPVDERGVPLRNKIA